MKITLRHGIALTAKEVEQIDHLFDSAPPEALVYQGRNTLKYLQFTGGTVVAKRFRKPDIFKKIGALLHGSKAIRAFRHATYMTEHKLPTPKALAVVEHAPSGHDYLLTEVQPGISLEDTLALPDTDQAQLAGELARFALRLMRQGVLHQDFNDTNIRVITREDGTHDFAIIDINRMDLYKGMPPYRARLDSLQRFSRYTEFYKLVLRAYLEASGEYTPEREADERRRKQRRDRRRDRKKRVLYALKRLIS